MRPAEAQAIVALVQATWPWPLLPDSSVARWAAMLGELEAGDAREAVDRLALREDRMPSIARIREEARIIRQGRQQGHRALPAPRLGPEEQAQIRGFLARWKERRGWRA